MGSGSLADQAKARARYLRSICSPNVANMIIYNQMLSEGEKMQILEIARKIAFERGRMRVYMEDWSDALKIWREKQAKKEESKNE